MHGATVKKGIKIVLFFCSCENVSVVTGSVPCDYQT